MLAFAFLLLLVAFRSIVVPLKAIVLNLLSVAAAYGVLVLVFQHHWAEPLLGLQVERRDHLLAADLPLRRPLRALDGLPRLHPQPRPRGASTAGMPTDAAVRYGITVTAGVVTSAALVMVAVFSLFGTLSSLEIKQAGVGLAAAVLIDATIVRAVLLPASMKLLGEWNWYLPRALQWLPRASTRAAPAGRDRRVRDAAMGDARRPRTRPGRTAGAARADGCRPAVGGCQEPYPYPPADPLGFSTFAPAAEIAYHSPPKASTSSPLVWPFRVSLANV